MVKRPVFHAEFGRFLVELREQKGWNQSQAAHVARRRGIDLGPSTIRWLEDGLIKSPEPSVLRSIADLYSTPYVVVIRRWLECRYKLTAEELAGHLATPPAEVLPAKGQTIEAIESRIARDVPEFRRVPLLANPIAAGPPIVIEDDEPETYLAFNQQFLRRFKDPICLRVGKHQESMVPTILPHDVVLLDRDPDRRLHPTPANIYALNLDEGGTLKRVELVAGPRGTGHWLAAISENPDKDQYGTTFHELDGDRSLLEIVVGEVVWHGQYIGSRRPRAAPRPKSRTSATASDRQLLALWREVDPGTRKHFLTLLNKTKKERRHGSKAARKQTA